MLLTLENITKSYTLGNDTVRVLSDVNCHVYEGDFLSIMGTSGSGRTTLLHILGTLLQPDTGSYFLDGKNMLTQSDTESSWIRAHLIGYVFQTFDLLPELNVKDNVALPYLYRNIGKKEMELQVDEAVDQVGLTARKLHRPSELSGGEMQRVAIARALAIKPKILLADEPTGNLDKDNSDDILSLFRTLNNHGTTIILVTHDPLVANVTKRLLSMNTGTLTEHQDV